MLSEALRRRLPESPLGAGCMIGSSLDGLDVALLRFSAADAQFVGGASSPLRHADTARLRAIAEGEATSAAELGALAVALALDHAEAIAALLRELGVGLDELDFVGAHGVTISHRPRAARHPHSWQLLDGQTLAARLRCPVLCEFRAADVALGGEGAPLAPIVDARRRSATEDRAILNLGGIMNVSLLPADPARAVVAADVGPANLPLDWLWRQAGAPGPFDTGGALARQGEPDERCCAEFLEQEWVRRALPRSYGREEFGQRFAAALIERMPQRSLADRLRTMVEIEARACAIFVQELVAWRTQARFRLLLTGGGRHHAGLCDALRRALPDADVEPIETIGIDGDLKEAIDFAWLAWLRLSHLRAPAPLARAHLGSLHFPVE